MVNKEKPIKRSVRLPVTFHHGSITDLPVDVMVNSAHPTLLAGSGVSGAIHKVAGKELEEECVKLGLQSPGAVVVTQAYKLPAKFVFHAVTPRHLPAQTLTKDTLAQLGKCYRKALDLATEHKLDSISFPLLGIGKHNFTIGPALRTAATEILSHPFTTSGKVTLVSTDEEALERMEQAIISVISQKALNVVYSSTRSMPAHLNSNGDRTQSFGVEFEPLSAGDEYEMASNVWHELKPPKEVSSERAMLVLKCGEDIMLGSYVIAKQGYPELSEEMNKMLKGKHDFDFRRPSRWKSQDYLFYEPWTKIYFAFCENYGKERAKSSSK